MGKGGWIRLLSATVFMSLLLLVFSGCAVPKNTVSPAPTTVSGTLIATLKPEGTNSTGSGNANLRMNPEHQEICSVIRVSGIELPATATHIHRGAAGVNDTALVPLTTPNAQRPAAGCAHALRDLIVAITQHPADYCVNVHNAPYPDGAVRGQFSECGARSGC